MADAKVIEDGDLMRVTIGPIKDQSAEYWFADFLHSTRLGVAYTEFSVETGRLCGYGVYRRNWEQFRFWLGVAIYENFPEGSK